MDPVGNHVKPSHSPASDTSSIKFDQNTTKHDEKQTETGPISTDNSQIIAPEATNVLITDARLIYRGKVISDSMQYVCDYGLHDGSVLHLVGKPRNKVVRDESPNESNNAISLDSACCC